MASTTYNDKTKKVGITLPNSLIKQTTTDYAVTFQEAHISVEKSSIILSKARPGNNYCSGDHKIWQRLSHNQS